MLQHETKELKYNDFRYRQSLKARHVLLFFKENRFSLHIVLKKRFNNHQHSKKITFNSSLQHLSQMHFA